MLSLGMNSTNFISEVNKCCHIFYSIPRVNNTITLINEDIE